MSSKNKKIAPFLGSGILASSSNRTDSGRLNCNGIITIFNSWGFPAVRNWQLIVTFFNLRKGSTVVDIFLIDKEFDQKTQLGQAHIKAGLKRTHTTLTADLSYPFMKEGFYEIETVFTEESGKLTIPFVVQLKEWPVFTNEEIQFVNSDKNFIAKAGAQIGCSKCDTDYVFEETIGNTKLTDGALRFPENGIHKCTVCGKDIHLKDIQGQLRSALKDSLKQKMGGK